jgi:hypothetical protein
LGRQGCGIAHGWRWHWSLSSVWPRTGTYHVLACFGVWLSVVQGTLSDDALHLLSDASPETLWCPLRVVVNEFCRMATRPAATPEELAFTQLALRVHCWPAAAEALQNALAKHPMTLRHFANGDRWPPSPDGQSGPLVGLWLWTRPAYPLPATLPPPPKKRESSHTGMEGGEMTRQRVPLTGSP